MTNQRKKLNRVSLPHSVFSADWVRQAERSAAQQAGLSLYELMERAGQAAFELARTTWPDTRHWLILCGHGNNGGDGYVVARLAAAAGLQVTLLAVEGERPLPDEAQTARQAWLASGGQIAASGSAWPENVDLIVDALLGIGFASAPRAPYDALIETINRHHAPVIALDIPSGLDAQAGTTPGVAVKAELTLCFVALKPGLLTGQARDCVGELHHSSLGLNDWLHKQTPLLERLDASQLSEWLKPRRPCSHKGEHGRLLVVGGDHGYAGAIRMAAEAALRSGAGMVRVLTHKQNISALLTARPELMVQELTDSSLAQGESWADVVVIGPGLGQGEWGKNALEQLAHSDKPALWDADALNMLAINPQKRQNRVLTPHPGEASRLLNCSVADIESNRLLSARKLVQRYGGTVVLKGAGTVIASEEGELSIADVGNAGMASGGMGDVLSGIIGALLAQKFTLYPAACIGCVVHGAAADIVADEQGTRGLLATDLLPVITKCVNPELQ